MIWNSKWKYNPLKCHTSDRHKNQMSIWWYVTEVSWINEACVANWIYSSQEAVLYIIIKTAQVLTPCPRLHRQHGKLYLDTNNQYVAVGIWQQTKITHRHYHDNQWLRFSIDIISQYKYTHRQVYSYCLGEVIILPYRLLPATWKPQIFTDDDILDTT